MREFAAETMPVGVVPESDARIFCEWMWRQKESSNFDPSVLAAPRTCMIKVTSGEKAVAFMPTQPVMMLESLCNDETLTKSELTLVVYEIHKLITRIMKDSGTMEAFFTTSNERFADLCQSNGWEKHLFDEKKHTWLMKLQIEAINAA